MEFHISETDRKHVVALLDQASAVVDDLRPHPTAPLWFQTFVHILAFGHASEPHPLISWTNEPPQKAHAVRFRAFQLYHALVDSFIDQRRRYQCFEPTKDVYSFLQRFQQWFGSSELRTQVRLRQERSASLRPIREAVRLYRDTIYPSEQKLQQATLQYNRCLQEEQAWQKEVDNVYQEEDAWVARSKKLQKQQQSLLAFIEHALSTRLTNPSMTEASSWQSVRTRLGGLRNTVRQLQLQEADERKWVEEVRKQRQIIQERSNRCKDECRAYETAVRQTRLENQTKEEAQWQTRLRAKQAEFQQIQEEAKESQQRVQQHEQSWKQIVQEKDGILKKIRDLQTEFSRCLALIRSIAADPPRPAGTDLVQALQECEAAQQHMEETHPAIQSKGRIQSERLRQARIDTDISKRRRKQARQIRDRATRVWAQFCPQHEEVERYFSQVHQVLEADTNLDVPQKQALRWVFYLWPPDFPELVPVAAQWLAGGEEKEIQLWQDRLTPILHTVQTSWEEAIRSAHQVWETVLRTIQTSLFPTASSSFSPKQALQKILDGLGIMISLPQILETHPQVQTALVRVRSDLVEKFRTLENENESMSELYQETLIDLTARFMDGLETDTEEEGYDITEREIGWHVTRLDPWVVTDRWISLALAQQEPERLKSTDSTRRTEHFLFFQDTMGTALQDEMLRVAWYTSQPRFKQDSALREFVDALQRFSIRLTLSKNNPAADAHETLAALFEHPPQPMDRRPTALLSQLLALFQETTQVAGLNIAHLHMIAGLTMYTLLASSADKWSLDISLWIQLLALVQYFSIGWLQEARGPTLSLLTYRMELLPWLQGIVFLSAFPASKFHPPSLEHETLFKQIRQGLLIAITLTHVWPSTVIGWLTQTYEKWYGHLPTRETLMHEKAQEQRAEDQMAWDHWASQTVRLQTTPLMIPNHYRHPEDNSMAQPIPTKKGKLGQLVDWIRSSQTLQPIDLSKAVDKTRGASDQMKRAARRETLATWLTQAFEEIERDTTQVKIRKQWLRTLAYHKVWNDLSPTHFWLNPSQPILRFAKSLLRMCLDVDPARSADVEPSFPHVFFPDTTYPKRRHLPEFAMLQEQKIHRTMSEQAWMDRISIPGPFGLQGIDPKDPWGVERNIAWFLETEMSILHAPRRVLFRFFQSPDVSPSSNPWYQEITWLQWKKPAVKQDEPAKNTPTIATSALQVLVQLLYARVTPSSPTSSAAYLPAHSFPVYANLLAWIWDQLWLCEEEEKKEEENLFVSVDQQPLTRMMAWFLHVDSANTQVYLASLLWLLLPYFTHTCLAHFDRIDQLPLIYPQLTRVRENDPEEKKNETDATKWTKNEWSQIRRLCQNTKTLYGAAALYFEWLRECQKALSLLPSKTVASFSSITQQHIRDLKWMLPRLSSMLADVLEEGLFPHAPLPPETAHRLKEYWETRGFISTSTPTTLRFTNEEIRWTRLDEFLPAHAFDPVTKQFQSNVRLHAPALGTDRIVS